MPRAAVNDVPPTEPARARDSAPPHAPFRLDLMTLADVVEVSEVERTVFPDPWSPDSFLAEVERRPDVGWPVVVRDGHEIVAYAVVWFIVDEIHIGNVAVRPDRQGRGVGRWLMERILAEGKRRSMVFATLEVRPSNRPALSLYESFGFRRVAVRRHYYRNDDEDAWVLAIALDPSAENRLG
jgi:ribosomal-protein-alanine N-acetyltransferase